MTLRVFRITKTALIVQNYRGAQWFTGGPGPSYASCSYGPALPCL